MAVITVIVPAYNTEKSLERCINSILQQTFEDYEVVIVDDGSPDSVYEISEKLAKDNKNVRVLHKTNGGLTSARKHGFYNSEGKYVCFVDSDDELNCHYLELLYWAINKNNADIAIAGYETISNESNNVYSFPFPMKAIEGSQNIREFFVEPLLGKKVNGTKIPSFVWNKLYKRQLITDECFKSEREFYLEDHIFNLEYAKHVEKIAVVNDPLYRYYVNPVSLTNRYRVDKWKMYCRLANYLTAYYHENISKDVIPEYLNQFMSEWFFDAVDNACKSGGYSKFVAEVREIMTTDTAVKIMQEISNSDIPLTHRLTKLLLKCRCYRGVYYYRLWRQQRVYRRK